MVYDALIARQALKAKAALIYTWNLELLTKPASDQKTSPTARQVREFSHPC